MKHSEMFKNAKWVSPLDKCDNPYMRREFTLKNKVKNAEITVCGLGFFMLYINGRKVSDDLFTPAYTDYHHNPGHHNFKVFGEILSHRIYCLKYDVKDYLIENNNALGAFIAPGWYKGGSKDGTYGFESDYGDVKFCYLLEVEYENGEKESFISDKNVKWTQSPLVKSHIRYGEEYDYNTYRLDGFSKTGFDDSLWEAATEVEAPDTEYFVQDCLPDKVIRRIKPKLIAETEDGFVYDMGENITGTPVIKAKENKVCEIKLTCSERILENGDTEDYTTHEQRSKFITDGTERLYRLNFTWYGFRYAKVSKNAEIVDCEVIHTDIKITSEFESDNELLNWLYDVYLRTQLDNIHTCIPSDCPHLEKQGYTADGQLTAENCMMMTSSRKMYEKWMEDISDSQDKISGNVQYCAPYLRCGGGPGGWSSGIIEIPRIYYKMYGDKSVLEKFIPKTFRYFDFLEAHSENDLVTSDQPGLWCLGDWCAPDMGFNELDKMVLPQPYVNTYFYVRSINQVIDALKELGETEKIPQLLKLRERKIKAIIDNYYDETTGDFAENLQGANVFALDLGLGDERTLNHVLENYRRIKCYDTGIFATDIVTRLLFERGYEQDAFNLLTSKGIYSYYNIMKTGATTLPEYWTFRRSQNHPMFGSTVKYIFTYLLGIVTVGPAYRKVLIEPRFVEGLNKMKGSLLTESGRISVFFVKEEKDVDIEITIPEGCEAEFKYKDEIIPLKAGTQYINLDL